MIDEEFCIKYTYVFPENYMDKEQVRKIIQQSNSHDLYHIGWTDCGYCHYLHNAYARVTTIGREGIIS